MNTAVRTVHKKKHLPSLQQMQQVSSANFVSVYKQNYLGSFAGSIAEDIGAIAFLSAIFFFFFFSLFLGLLSPMVTTSNHSLLQVYSHTDITAISRIG